MTQPIAALIVAAGRGLRVGGGIPKQWRTLAGKTVLYRTVEAFRSHPRVDRIVVVLHPDEIDRGAELGPDVLYVPGAASRDGSVRAGLEALAADPPGIVLIHDGARPLVPARVITDVITALDTHDGAAPALEVIDALWTGADGLVTGVRDRSGLWRAQTPQGFRFAAIHAAHLARGDRPAADDVEVAREAGLSVAIVPGDERNLKITRAEDFARAAEMLQEDNVSSIPDIRTGIGYDVHRFGDGDHVILCGVRVPHGRGLQGHSDADVGMHTITDAIYGALARGDIGQHFPPSDPQWKGAASEVFLKHACALAREMGFVVTHVDVTLVCEYPKIGPHVPAMRAEMARLMGLDIDRVSVKATTSERLGFTGREEGIAAVGTATLVKA